MDINLTKKGEITIIMINGCFDAETAPVADKAVNKIRNFLFGRHGLR